MITDKNPTFTLNNKKIRNIAVDTEFDIDLKTVIKRTLNKLESECDDEGILEYNMLSDVILMQYKRFKLTEKEKRVVADYVNNFSKSYKTKLIQYKYKKYIKSILMKGLGVLRKLKRRYLK